MVCFALLWSEELVPAGTSGLSSLLFASVCNRNSPHLQLQPQHSAFQLVRSEKYGTHSWAAELNLRREGVHRIDLTLKMPSSDPDGINA